MKINGSENTFANFPPSISLQYRTYTQYAACISEFQRKSQNTMKVLTRSLILQWYKRGTLLVLSRFKKNLAFNLAEGGNLIFSHHSAVKASAAMS